MILAASGLPLLRFYLRTNCNSIYDAIPYVNEIFDQLLRRNTRNARNNLFVRLLFYSNSSSSKVKLLFTRCNDFFTFPFDRLI